MMNEIPVTRPSVIVKESLIGRVISPSEFRCTFQVKGIIEDGQGNPITGVKIYLIRKKGDVLEDITRKDGMFAFRLKRRWKCRLVKEGYQTQVMQIRRKEASLPMRIILKRDSTDLGE